MQSKPISTMIDEEFSRMYVAVERLRKIANRTTCDFVWSLATMSDDANDAIQFASEAVVKAIAFTEIIKGVELRTYDELFKVKNISEYSDEALRRIAILRAQQGDMLRIANLMKPIKDRLVAIIICKKRLKGRADLQRKAERGDLFALAELEAMLGLSNVSVEAARLEMERTLSKLCCMIVRMVKKERTWNEYRDHPVIKTLREKRAADKKTSVPRPFRIYMMQAKRRVTGIFNTCKNSHTDVCVVVDKPEQVNAISSSTTISSSQAGMGKAYCRVQYTVKHSEHKFFVCPQHLPHVSGEYLYLSPSCRVRQGRGSSLVTERKTSSGRWIQQ